MAPGPRIAVKKKSVEQMFRYNNRLDMNDGDRFDLALRLIVGKRLTYAELTGKGQPERGLVQS